MNRKKIIASIIAIGLTLNIGVTAVAAPTVSNETKQQIEQKQAEYTNAEQKLNALEMELQKLQGEAEKIQGNINKTNTEISNKEKDIQKLGEEIEKLQKDLKEKEELYGKRMRAIYKSGTPGYIEVLVQSKGISDLVSNVQAVSKLMSLDKKMMNDINGKKNQVKKTQDGINNDKEALVELRSNAENSLVQLKDKQAKQKTLVEQADAEKKKVKVDLVSQERQLIQYPASVVNNSNSSIADLNASVESLRAIRNSIKVIDKEVVDLIEKAKAQVKAKEDQQRQATIDRGAGSSGSGSGSISIPTGSNASASAQKVLLYAYNFIGIPYVWGGSTPAGFDCSGFTSYVFNKFGIGIGRTTYEQVNAGRAVSISQAQPGDLVLFGDASAPHHVGIYVGGGSYIHAPRTGDVIKVSSLSGRSDLCAVRRVLN